MTGRSQSGFTLIELMVGLVLVGLITAVVGGVVRAGLGSTERVVKATERSEQVRLAQSAIRRHLQAARPVRLADARRPQVAFRGEEKVVRFVANMPPWIGRGGPHLVEIASRGGRLILSTRRGPTRIERVTFGRSSTETVLADGVRRVEFAYFGRRARDDETRWHARWVDRDRFPRLVRLRVDFADGRSAGWPDLVVAPMIEAAPR